MKYRVVEEHKPNNRNPIRVKKGETVILGRKSDEEDGWGNWIYCHSLHGTNEGWTPVQIIQIENGYGVVLSDYSAKELDARKGDVVDSELELNGWLWCSRSINFEDGWLPAEKLIALQDV